MIARSTDIAIIGAGQAGLATSWRLTGLGVGHLVLDADRIGSTWLTRRWDSFRLVSPDHLNELPGGGPVSDDPDAFATAAVFVAYLERYAASFGAPVETGVHVRHVEDVEREPVEAGGGAYLLDTSGGPVRARAWSWRRGHSGRRSCRRSAHPCRHVWPS